MPYGNPLSEVYLAPRVDRYNRIGGSTPNHWIDTWPETYLNFRKVRTGVNSPASHVTLTKHRPSPVAVTRLRKVGRLASPRIGPRPKQPKSKLTPQQRRELLLRKKQGRLPTAPWNELVKRHTWNVYAYQTRYIQGKVRTKAKFQYRNANPLHYVEESWSTGTDNPGSVRAVAPGGYVHEYVGSLWTPFLHIGTSDPCGPNPQDFAVPSGRFDLEASRLENELLAKLTDYTTSVNLSVGQIVAERKQTKNLLIDAVRRLKGAIRRVRKGDLSLVDQVQKGLLSSDTLSLANDYLAYEFGVKPLVNDVVALFELLRSTITLGGDFRRSKRYVLDPMTIYESNYRGVQSKVTESGWVEVKLRVIFRVQNPGVQLLYALGLAPASLAWELTPWSFALDWLSPIGDRIFQEEALYNVEPLSVVKTVSTYRMLTIDKTFQGNEGDGYIWQTQFGGTVRFAQKRFSVDRQVLTEIPLINPFVIKRASDIVDLRRSFLSLALLRQQLK